MTTRDRNWTLEVHKEVIRRLVRDFGLKEREKYLQQGECPRCGKKEMYISTEKPFLLKCGRENNCGHEISIRSLYPDLFENWSRRYQSTPASPDAAADAYLSEGRGLNISRFKGCYRQGAFARDGLGTATVRFTLSNGSKWERFIDEPERFGKQKANFIGAYAGHWWEPPGMDLREADNIWITEGIFNAMSLVQSGQFAVATLSSNNYPSVLLAMLAEAIPEPDKRPRLIWAFDNDRAGRSHITKFAQRAETDGWKVSAALPSENAGKLDWNDLLMRERLLPEHIKRYRHYGRLLLAKSASEKALLIHDFINKNAFHFVFNNCTYWFSLDFDRYMKAVDRIRDYDQTCYSEEDARNRALKETGAIEEIINCAIHPLYFLESRPTDEAWYYLRIDLPHAPSVKGAFTAAQIASAPEFKKRLLHIAKGVVYAGTAKQLDKIIHSFGSIRDVLVQDFIGYNKKFQAWLFNDVAVSGGALYRLNEEDYFDIPGTGVKSLSLSPHLSINADFSQFEISWLDDIWTAFGTKGYVALAFWLGSLFAEQVRDRMKSWPILEISGEPGTGKTTLLEFLWKLCGREDYEGFDPSKATAAARGRNFAQVANLPVVLMEGDRTGTADRPSKQRAFDYDELKTLYNGRSPRALGVKANNNETSEPLFRGSIVIAQNAEVDGSDALLSRIIHMYTDKSGQTDDTQRAAERLEQIPVKAVSGFILKATLKEKEVMQTFYSAFSHAIKEFSHRNEVKHRRITKTHAQLIAMLEALPLVVPVSPQRVIDTRDYIFSLAFERQRSLSQDHPLVQEFWELFEYLDAQETYGLNHAAGDKEGEVAVNFNHLEEVAAFYRLRLPFALSEIKKLLKNGQKYKFVRIGSVRSVVSEKYNAGKTKEQRKPEVYHCWIFKGHIRNGENHSE